MENCEKQKKIVKMNVIEGCERRSFCWPTIKVSACITPITPTTPAPVNPPIIIPDLSIIPTVKRYFYVATANINLVNGTTLPATLFSNDDGSQTTEFMNFSPNGYADLFINAVIQEGGMYRVDSNALTINPTTGVIFRGTPIILELITFVAEQRS